MKLNSFLIVAFSILSSSCSVQLTLRSATVQEWVGGAAGSGGGSKYIVAISKTGNSEVSINSVWLGDREKGVMADYRIFADSSGRIMKQIPPETGLFRIEMSVQNRHRESRDDAGSKQGEQKTTFELPDGFQKGLIITYSDKKGKKGQLVVQEFKRLEPLIYP